ncbi:MAG TPA: ATP-dependent zinc protease [Methylophaga aminisulfidivorans]|nr:ATP-dependent zinc protease [Methylophaga aminisulfidivorans]
MPPVSAVELADSLKQTESRLAEKIQQQCDVLGKAENAQTENLAKITKKQATFDGRLDVIEGKIDTVIVKQHKGDAAPPLCPKPAVVSNNTGNKLVVGRTEWLWLEAVNRVYEARVDTGAATSSISALDITPFEKDGKNWVRFRLAPDDGDDSFEVEAPLVRYVKIRQASTDTLDRRPVASLTVRLGTMTEVAEFTLNDRTQMTYPILLGREFLRDVAVVDVAKDNIQIKPEIVQNQPQATSVSKSKKQ